MRSCPLPKLESDMANAITCGRIAFSIALLLSTPLSPCFYVLYILAGFTDVLDGLVARRTNTVTEFGSMLDTGADFVFLAVCFIRLAPILVIPSWLYAAVAVIALIKLSNLLCGCVGKGVILPHTVMNKLTGLLFFLLPLTLSFIDLRISATICCAAAAFAAVQEGHYIRKTKHSIRKRITGRIWK